jgi:hypothetical protein
VSKQTYEVTWLCQVEADSPEEAALEAQRIQRMQSLSHTHHAQFSVSGEEYDGENDQYWEVDVVDRKATVTKFEDYPNHA